MNITIRLNLYHKFHQWGWVLLFIVSCSLAWPRPSLAQPPPEEPQTITWRELTTDKFIIVYAEAITQTGQPVACPHCGAAEARRYAQFIDGVYGDLAEIFTTDLETPINLRLFPTEKSYFVVNPLAEYLTGVIAHALNNRTEIAVAIPRTETLSDADLVNNMRHELTHLFASQLSDGKLRAGFQEGIAQYLEKPTYDQAAYAPALLKVAQEEQRLLTWRELDEAREAYSDPQVAYPQSLAIVSFLIDRYGFPQFRQFLQNLATESNYRPALQKTYQQSAETLEQEWLAYLPSYFENRWQINALYHYDLGRVTDLVQRGAYNDSKTELTEIIKLLQTTAQTTTLAQAQTLLHQAETGLQAGELTEAARAALMAGNYDLAITQGQAALLSYSSIGYTGRLNELQTYLYRAQLGQEAWQALAQSRGLLRQWRFFEAQTRLYQATIQLQALNDRAGVEQGQELLQEALQQQRYLAYFLLSVGAILLMANGVRRVITRLIASPLEVELP